MKTLLLTLMLLVVMPSCSDDCQELRERNALLKDDINRLERGPSKDAYEGWLISYDKHIKRLQRENDSLYRINDSMKRWIMNNREIAIEIVQLRNIDNAIEKIESILNTHFPEPTADCNHCAFMDKPTGSDTCPTCNTHGVTIEYCVYRLVREQPRNPRYNIYKCDCGAELFSCEFGQKYCDKCNKFIKRVEQGKEANHE